MQWQLRQVSTPTSVTPEVRRHLHFHPYFGRRHTNIAIKKPIEPQPDATILKPHLKIFPRILFPPSANNKNAILLHPQLVNVSNYVQLDFDRIIKWNLMLSPCLLLKGGHWHIPDYPIITLRDSEAVEIQQKYLGREGEMGKTTINLCLGQYTGTQQSTLM